MILSHWIKVTEAAKAPLNSGFCYSHGSEQIAIFNFNRETWYATQNLCPHQKQMVMSRGLIGDSQGQPKVSCPLHKNAFSLKTGQCLDQDKSWSLKTYAVKVEEGQVFIEVDA